MEERGYEVCVIMSINPIGHEVLRNNTCVHVWTYVGFISSITSNDKDKRKKFYTTFR